MLHLSAVNLGGPIPAKLIQGFNDWKASQANAIVGGAVAPQEGFAFDQLAEIVDMGPLLVGRLLGEGPVVFRDKGEFQVMEMARDILWGHRVGWGFVA
jgi:hypothetical protein